MRFRVGTAQCSFARFFVIKRLRTLIEESCITGTGRRITGDNKFERIFERRVDVAGSTAGSCTDSRRASTVDACTKGRQSGLVVTSDEPTRSNELVVAVAGATVADRAVNDAANHRSTSAIDACAERRECWFTIAVDERACRVEFGDGWIWSSVAAFAFRSSIACASSHAWWNQCSVITESYQWRDWRCWWPDVAVGAGGWFGVACDGQPRAVVTCAARFADTASHRPAFGVDASTSSVSREGYAAVIVACAAGCARQRQHVEQQRVPVDSACRAG
jgi:hypothetical protein